jgi:NADH-quinone oxidoreductase subunit H
VTAQLVALLVWPGGAAVVLCGLVYEWMDRKLVARLQNRTGPRWFQPISDVTKLLAKEEIVPSGANPILFNALPVVALASVLTAALYVPMAGLAPAWGFSGDLIVTLYLLSLLSVCVGMAGVTTTDRFAVAGASRVFTQVFAYEAPWLVALLGPAVAAGSWRIGEIATFATGQWLVMTQPIGFLVAIFGLVGKLEMAPLDAPEAETELVAGPLTEYSGRGLALFRLAKDAALTVGLALIAAFYLGGAGGVLEWALKTGALLVLIAFVQTLFARVRIDQTVALWWRFGASLAILQLVAIAVWSLAHP